ncbi:hypothetical protein M426DRAFT_188321 [Hypoxylon sp. CI-4A]|nr:hypothetical protein M426DRAFT_188321 [Hypoxylon sp. CI-4A]
MARAYSNKPSCWRRIQVRSRWTTILYVMSGWQYVFASRNTLIASNEIKFQVLLQVLFHSFKSSTFATWHFRLRECGTNIHGRTPCDDPKY